MSFALLARIIIYYLEGLLSILPSLVPFAHLTLVTLFLLLPRGAFVLSISLLVSFLDSRIELFLSICNNRISGNKYIKNPK